MLNCILLILTTLVGAAHSPIDAHGLHPNQSIVHSSSDFSFGSPQNNLAIGLAPTSAAFAAGQPILIRIALKNLSAQSRQIVQSSLTYQFIVKDAAGRVVNSDLKYGDVFNDSRDFPLQLDPGGAVEQTENLRRRYFLKAGEYSATVYDGVSEFDSSTGKITANTYLVSATVKIKVSD